jgi:hypothetical protein
MSLISCCSLWAFNCYNSTCYLLKKKRCRPEKHFPQKAVLISYMSCPIGTKKWCESNNLCFDGWRCVGNEREKGRGFTLVLVYLYLFF